MFQNHIDLNMPPESRWEFSAEQFDMAKRLTRVYAEDLAIPAEMMKIVGQMVMPLIPREYLAEIQSIADKLDVTLPTILMGNVYYDCLKHVLGCTAFAKDTPSGPIHARNLDWWSVQNTLAKGTQITHFAGAPAGEFSVVGWPGFVGVFSGMAKRRFSISLNAVISGETSQITTPVVFLIRKVFETCKTYDEAVRELCNTVIPCDCLLLVCGIRQGEMIVIERTPTRHALRHPSNGSIAVTNGFLKMDMDTGAPQNLLQETSCGRYERICRLLEESSELRPEECLDMLSDQQVQMNITVQQMVFQPSTEALKVQLPTAK